MTSSMPLLSHSPLPTPAQLALALLVLKSKPTETSLEDHVSQLRVCIKSGSRTSPRHLDSCAFWKQAFEKSEAAQSGLFDTVHELKQQMEQLSNESHQSKSAAMHSGVKRKRSVNSLARQSTNGKRNSATTMTTGMQEADSGSARCSTDLQLNKEIDGSSTAFARTFFELRRCMSCKRPKVGELAVSLRGTCVAADKLLSESIDSSLRTQGNAKKAQEAEAALRNLIKVPRALRLSYTSLLGAVDKVAVQAENGVTQSPTSAIVVLFQDILGHLHSVSAKKSEITSKDNRSTHGSKPRTVKHQNLATSKLEEVCSALTRLLIHFSEALDFSRPSHNKIFEGLICVFLDHLGSSLSLIVFGDIESGSSKPQELGVLPPRGLIDVSGVNQEIAIRTAKHEACYLVTILRHLMLCVEKQQSLMRSRSTPFLESKKSFATSNGAFASRIRKKLQDTLLRGVFGDDDESFKDAFQRPAANSAGDSVEVASQNHGDTGEWFVGEVWSVLGWSTLTEEDAA